MIGQMYTVKMQPPDCIDHVAKPAQFVYESDDSSIVIGFVVNVDDDILSIALGEPQELPHNGTLVKESLTPEEVRQLLLTALEENPRMRQEWIEIFNDS